VHQSLQDFPWLYLIPLLPLLGAAWNGVMGSRTQARFGHAAVHLPAILLPAGSFIIALWAFITLAGAPHGASLYNHLWSWLPVGALNADTAFLMDRLSGVMTLVVTFVGTLIHVYSVGYMHEEPAYWRFFAYLNLFMFAMLVLVLGDNFLLMFVGWEGVGLCSYLLISFWWRDRDKAAAGMKAFVVNRVGDLGFSLGVFLLFWGLLAVAGATSITFRGVEEMLTNPANREGLINTQVWGVGLMTLVCLLLFVGATGKSAQLPLYVWLPDAMAGPTPVSALIHAATMVTAGVYMVARLHFLFTLSPVAMTVVATVGALTALFAASIGLFQYDIKKVLAYSTVSQLGFMFVAVGVGAYWVGIFHLVTHAFFKACLFLGSGSVILGCHHEQDMRRMGGLRKLMPITAVTYLLSCAAIAGFPFFSGFFSKDEILWKVFDTGNLLLPGGGLILWGIVVLAALGTAFYMFRSYYMTFSGEYRGHAHTNAHGNAHSNAHSDGAHGRAHVPHESPASMTGVLAVLGGLAVVGGYLGLPRLWHLPNLFEAWLEPVFEGTSERVLSAGFGHGAEWGLMGFSIVVAFAGFLAARLLYKDGRSRVPARLLESRNKLVRGVHRVIFNKYYVDEAYDAAIVRPSLGLSRALALGDARVIDALVLLVGVIGRALSRVQGAFDRLFVDGLVERVGRVVRAAGGAVRRVQTGRVQAYVQGMAMGAVALVVLAYLLAW
jgi:NADH-quinone oxidoreductase subunit L